MTQNRRKFTGIRDIKEKMIFEGDIVMGVQGGFVKS